METYKSPVNLSKNIELGSGTMVLIAGPCAIESFEICIEVGRKAKKVCQELGLNYVFKASFDKANRTSLDSYRGVGLEQGLEILLAVKKDLEVPVLTDVHETWQVKEVAKVADVLQIPAFLSRQTDLIVECAKSGRAVNIKKGQFMKPEDMIYSTNKVRESGNANVFLTERGSSFGYGDLVVDYRSLPIMRQFAPVVFDVTHSIQQPGGLKGKSGGRREFASYLAKAAVAVGIDGLFVETHPNPDLALSDGPNMIALGDLKDFWGACFDLSFFYSLYLE